MRSDNIKPGAFKSECFQVLRNPWLYVAMAVALGVLLNDSMAPLWRTITGEYPRYNDSPERYSTTMLFGMIVLLVPLLCAFPYASSYVNDASSGMLRMRVTRCGRLNRYISAKYGATFMSGALALSVPIALYIVIVVAICGGYQYCAENPNIIEEGMFAPLLIWGGAPFFLVQIAMLAVFGGLWSCVGLAVSAWVENRYVAVVAPFVVYFAMLYLSQYLEVRMLDPGELVYLMPEFQLDPPKGICVLTVIPLCELALVYFVFRRGVLRRVENGRI